VGPARGQPSERISRSSPLLRGFGAPPLLRLRSLFRIGWRSDRKEGVVRSEVLGQGIREGCLRNFLVTCMKLSPAKSFKWNPNISKDHSLA